MMNKLLLFILSCLIIDIGKCREPVKGISEENNKSEARIYYLNAAEKAESRNYAGVIQDIVNVMFTDSGYLEAKFYYIRVRDKYGSQNFIKGYQYLVLTVADPRREIRGLKHSIYKFKDIHRAVKYLKGEITLDILIPELSNIRKLYDDHLKRIPREEFIDNLIFGLINPEPEEVRQDYSEIQQKLKIPLTGKEFRTALLMDYNDLVSLHKSEMKKE